MTLAGTRISILPMEGEGTNDRSLILLLEYGNCRALFAADMEKEAEASLSRRSIGHVDLLKVAHHGSRTSSTEKLLRSLTPRWAVISVGARNLYGHPHPTVLRRLLRHGVQVFRTDFHGYVRFRLEPQGSVHCETALGSCGVSSCGRAMVH
jgi:competence protein ComEC